MFARWWSRPFRRRAPRKRFAPPLCLDELESRTLLSGSGLSSAILLGLPGTASGFLSIAPDFYRVNLTQAGRLTAIAQPGDGHTTGFHARLSLLDANGQVLMQSDGQSPTNPDDLIDLHVEGARTGTTYYLEVQGLGGASGAYALQTGFATATPPFQPLAVGDVPWGHAFDLTGKGTPDLVFANFGTLDVSVRLGRGDGTFAPEAHYNLSIQPLDVTALDLRGNGVMDLVTANWDGTLSVLRGKGDGTFARPTRLQVAGALSFSALVAGDFKGDGHQDLAVADISGRVAVLLNNGDGTFAAPRWYAVGDSPSDIIAADFTHSGHLDLATTNANSNSVSVLVGNGDGTFGPQRTFAVGQGPRSLVAADLNGDGRLDIATANTGSNDVSVLLGKGDGTFAAAKSLRAGVGTTGIVAADFSGDGHVDLAATNLYDGTLSIFRGRGDGSYKPQVVVHVGSTPACLVAADFNGDGHIDLAHGDVTGHLSIDLGRGDGTFQTLPATARTAEPLTVASGDFARDGRLDLAVADFGTGDVEILLGRQDGTFQIGGRYAAGPDPTAIAVGDFNGDGIPDLVVTDPAVNEVAVLLGRGDGTFGAPTFYAAGAMPEGVVVGRFTHSGHLDIAVADIASNCVAVLRGDGHGSFSAPLFTRIGGVAPISLTAGDFDGDGTLDLATANAASNDVSVLFGAGDGTFAREERLKAGYAPYAIVTGDFRGDGLPGLAVANFGSWTVSVFLNLPNAQGKPSGIFTAQAVYAAGIAPYNLVAADLKHDGHSSLVVADAGGNTVTVLLAQPDGSFRAGGQLAVGDAPTGIAVGDFTGDGLPDLATANFNSGDVSVLVNGGAAFRAQVRTPVPDGPVAVLQDDLNNDGSTDLVTANFDAGTVSVRLGNGDGTFRDPVNFTVGHGPDALAVADFNGDGRDDLAVANFLDGTVSVLFGNGDGTFQAQQTYAVGKEPDAIVAGDFNGDGIPDLAVANYGSGTVSILLGRRGGGFQVPITLPVGAGPRALALADVDGDGTPDLVVGDYLSHDVTVLLGDGRGNFRAESPVVLPAGPESLATGDFNGDGVPDVAVACPADGGVFLLPGQRLATAGPGGYALGAPQLVASAGTPVALAAGDFNGDGRLDLAYADSNANVVRVLLGRGDGTFQARAPFSVEPYPFALAAGDFSNDGRLSLVTANGLGVPVSVALGLGDGTFATVAAASAPLQAAPIVADLNHDGVPDIIVLRQDGKILFRPGVAGRPGVFGAPVVVNPDPAWAARDIVVGPVGGSNMLLAVNARTNTEAVYAYVGGRFLRIYVGPIQAPLPSFLVGGDLNGDGLPDLVIASSATGRVYVALQRPHERFGHGSWDYQFQVSPGISSIALADLNGNGLPDIVITNQITGEVDVLVNAKTNPVSTRLHFRSGSGLTAVGQDGGATQVQSGDEPVAVVAGRFEGGPLPDLAVLNRGADRVDLLVADGQGGVFNPAPGAALLTGRDPVAIVTGDFNGDGHPDLAVLNKGSDDISVFLGDGHGHFTEKLATGPDGQPIRLGAGNAPTGLSVADVNGDDRLDLLVSNAQGDVLILYGNGDGTFRPYRRLDRHTALAVADLTGRGGNDFVLASASQDLVTAQYAQPGPSFSQTRVDGIRDPNAVKLVDLNGDGLPDLVVANGGGNDVLVYPGLPGGGFGPAQSFFTGTDPVGITVADLNGNGIPDLVIANKGSNDVSILYGQGRGTAWTLVPGPRLRAGEGPVATAVAYIGGVPNIFVANSGSNDVYQLRGVGGGFFDDRNPVVFPAGIDPEALFVGNFDGRLDLVTINAGSNDLTLFSGFGPGRSISSGGMDPAAVVMGDFRHDGFDDLIVANGDSRFTLLMGGPDGLQDVATLRRPDLANPSDIALASLGPGGVSIYVTTAGQELVAGLTFALDLSPVLPPGGGPPAALSSVPPAAEFSGMADTALGTVATLVLGTADAPPAGSALAAVPEPAAGEAPAVSMASSTGGVVGAYFDMLTEPDSRPALPTGAAQEAGLAAFLLGLDELPFERRLGDSPAAVERDREPALWDWLSAGAPSSLPRVQRIIDQISWERAEPGTPGGGAGEERLDEPQQPFSPRPGVPGGGDEAEGSLPGEVLLPHPQPLSPEAGAKGDDAAAVGRRPLAALALYIGSGLVVTTAEPRRRRKR
jgi:hypothetical protein